VRFAIASDGGKLSVLIDAPLEKFKGETAKLSGVIDVQPDALTQSKGEIDGDLDAFVTHTFNDKDKDETQTEHAKNWFELGDKVDAKMRDDYRMARFIIESIEKSSVKSLADAPEENGVRTVKLEAKGTLRVHGRSAPKTVAVTVKFSGPPMAPTSLRFSTDAPLVASLSEHDVKPRDLAGKFLNGALEQVGKKLDDKAQVSVEGKADAKPVDAMMAAPSAPGSAGAAPSAAGSAK
jgi:hypothetical protein